MLPTITATGRRIISATNADSCAASSSVDRCSIGGQGPIIFATGSDPVAGEQRGKNGEAALLGSLEVDDELQFCGLHHWQVRRFLTLQNAAGRSRQAVDHH